MSEHLNDLGIHIIPHRACQIKYWNGVAWISVQTAIDQIDSAYAPGVQDISTLKAVPASLREDKQVRLVEDKGTTYYFDAQGLGADDGDFTIIPDDITYPLPGRWYKMPSNLIHGNLLGLDQDDHPQYVFADGTRAFTGTVSGVYPTLPAHLATKLYVDNSLSSHEATYDHDDIALNTAERHSRLHSIDSTLDHVGVSGATEDNLIAFDANGLPKDSNLSEAGIDAKILATSGVLQEYINIERADREPTGFEDHTSSTISFDNNTRRFSIVPTSGSFTYYTEANKYTVSASGGINISDVEGNHFIYYDGPTLTETTTFTESIITRKAYVAMVHWNADDGEAVVFGDERHGIVMDGLTHVHLHESLGAQFINGLTLGDINSDATGTQDSHATCSVAGGRIRDEDLEINIIDGSPQDLDGGDGVAQIPVYYRVSSGLWRKSVANDFPVLLAPTGNQRIAYNGWNGTNWSQTEPGNGALICYHIFATNNITEPIVSIQGMEEYDDLGEAQSGAVDEVNILLIEKGLPFAEFVPIGTLIYETNNSYSNSVNGRIRALSTGEDYIDWRSKKILPAVGETGGGGTTDHGLLTGLSDDDHPQYILVDGTRRFTGPVSGIYPTGSGHLATKQYPDDLMATHNSAYAHTDIALNTSHRNQTTGNPHQLDYNDIINYGLIDCGTFV